jgi:hypothetical protein
MDKQKIFASFQHYDVKGRRLSIFGTPFKDGSGMEILVFFCSKQDQFSKEYGWNLYRSFRDVYQFKEVVKMSPYMEVVPGTSKKDFIIWCNNLFYKKGVHLIYLPGIYKGKTYLEVKLLIKP